ncbi:substrate-binding domain-containing protein [Geosporobacter ferrireducens]|uniref:Tungsten ABC transporter substrate-binding protein n=1 Tax=Geosporobacter ferrireducens TaxID=1424294 RepID=A0A1D8GLH1_9FIRM|nr:substrate-binding domain-containing protein [Geosporobacter ferrireducens]AOT71755.1 tungsten ABC transporter substrate-binding protein [Geosporobacter ferrireducens]MTI55539.1 tungsten ABC transporter substrate-binding protein [Geosporobacter ferrireducens]
MQLWRNKGMTLILVTVFIILAGIGCAKPAVVPEQPVVQEKSGEDAGSLMMATTTSTENSGLLTFLLPKFKEDTGIDVKVVAVGTGQTLKLGEDGEADVLLAHAKSAEEEFVKAGHGLERFDVMYNDFILIGPKEDPLQIKEKAGSDITAAVQLIHEQKRKFLSRGDDSGTHKAEIALWKEMNVEPAGDWYLSVGRGMGEVILMTHEVQGYTLSDRATYLSMRDKVGLEILVEGDSRLFNQYGVIAVNPNKNDKINSEGAQVFINWILSEKGQEFIAAFGKEQYGQSLFIPNGKQ